MISCEPQREIYCEYVKCVFRHYEHQHVTENTIKFIVTPEDKSVESENN